MSRAQKGLLSGEGIVYSTKVHWNVLLLPLLLMLVVSAPALYGYFVLTFSAKLIFVAVALVPVVMFLVSYIKRNASEFVVTNLRVIIYLGVLTNQSFEMTLNRVESVSVEQKLWGKIFNFGLLMVVGTGGTKERFANIQSPFMLRKKIEEQMGKTPR
jgi:uncharacterized membrane protein YdbT with pleckstrin-like domain